VGAERLGEATMRSPSPTPGYPLSSRGPAGLHCRCPCCHFSRYSCHVTRRHRSCYAAGSLVVLLRLPSAESMPLDLVPVPLVPLGQVVWVFPPWDSVLLARVAVLLSSERDSLRFLLVPRFGDKTQGIGSILGQRTMSNVSLHLTLLTHAHQSLYVKY